jgi:hypothetical protein
MRCTLVSRDAPLLREVKGKMTKEGVSENKNKKRKWEQGRWVGSNIEKGKGGVSNRRGFPLPCLNLKNTPPSFV